MKDFYRILGVERNVSQDTIQAAYRRLALMYHPDKNVGNEEWATKLFKDLTEAYGVLGDPERRKVYDRSQRGPIPVARPPVRPEDALRTAAIGLAAILAEQAQAVIARKREEIENAPSFLEVVAEKAGFLKPRPKQRKRGAA